MFSDLPAPATLLVMGASILLLTVAARAGVKALRRTLRHRRVRHELELLQRERARRR